MIALACGRVGARVVMLSARRNVVACVRVGARVLMLSARGNAVRVGVRVFASVRAANTDFHTVT